MTHEEDELRRALDARSGAPSPEFRSRLGQALSTRPAAPDLTPAIAVATVVVLTLTSVGILVGAGHLGRARTAASGAPSASPSPGPYGKGGFRFQLSAPSSNVVWALYDPDKLYRSTDGGSSWEVRSMPKQWGVHPIVSFIDDQQGWWLAPGSPTSQCQAADTVVWHTTDAGATWSELGSKGFATTQCKDGIWFSDAQHGFVTAHDPNHQPTVYRTADGGHTWVGTTLQDPAYFKSGPGGFTLQVDWIKAFGATLYLEAFGAQSDANLPHDNQFVLRSVDGGASWVYVTKVPSRALVMVTEERWLDFTNPGQAMESTNGGQQFHQFASNLVSVDPSSTQFVFADAQVGYAATAGKLERTADGGSKWRELPPPGLGNVQHTPSPIPSSIPMPTDVRLSAPSPQVVWALVASQFLFRSTDQGATWQQENLPSEGSFSDVSFVDESDGWVLRSGPGGTQCSFGPATIWRTSDAGAHWSVVTQVDLQSASAARSGNGSIAGEQCKENLSFVDKQRGFLDAWDENSPPSIYRTSDGGVTWSRGRLSDPPGFKTIGAGDALQAGPVTAFGNTMLVEAGGMQPDGRVHWYVFESTDGGATWRFVAPVSSSDMAFVTATRWIALFEHLETTDSGKSFHPYASDYTQAAGVAPEIVFAGSSVGYATVRGSIQRTTDGGGHWVFLTTPGT